MESLFFFLLPGFVLLDIYRMVYQKGRLHSDWTILFKAGFVSCLLFLVVKEVFKPIQLILGLLSPAW